MGELVQFVTPLHQATSRAYIDRMVDDKVHCMLKAKEYEGDYWDGDRRYGYGGYSYIPGRWKPVAELLIDAYNLNNQSSLLDVGCGKGYLLYELKLLLPGLEVFGIDISEYGIQQAKREVSELLTIHKAQDPYPFGDGQFDLVISIGCLHNLKLYDVERALKEIDRVGNQSYVMVESYRNESEQFNLQCWALTAQSFFEVDEWLWLYKIFGYKGDYEFIVFA